MVCLTISCDEERSNTNCEEIIIPEACEDCDTLKNHIATFCEPEDSTQASIYITNITVQVPNGYTTCKENNLHVWSEEVAMVDTSFYIDTSFADYDEINVAVLIIPPIGYDFDSLGATGYMTFCNENGDMVCYTFYVQGKACDRCLPAASSDAHCNDPDITDNIFIYDGTATIELPGVVSSEFCGVTAEEAGFSIISQSLTPNLPSGPNVWTVNYSITTTQSNLESTSALFCYYDNINLIEICVPLDISIDPSCIQLPEDCEAQWATKYDTCDSQQGGYAVFNMPIMSIYVGSYVLCNNGLFGTIEGGGMVVINSESLVNGWLTFSHDILMPSNFDQSLEYKLRLYLCDGDGAIVCYLFPYRLTCSGGGEGGGSGLIRNGSTTTTTYSLFPNPARDRLTIITEGLEKGTLSEFKIMDGLGRTLANSPIISPKQEINVSGFNTGIYFVAIMEGSIPVKVEKVVIIR